MADGERPEGTSGVIFCDEGADGFSWIAPEPSWMERTSHALVADGGVWLVDPVDVAGLDERVRRAGAPRAVVQLLDRHNRDSAAIARRLGVPYLVTPAVIPDAPFETTTLKTIPGWRETALWWPGRRTLVVAEAVGTAAYYCAPGRPLGVHPLLRLLRPPRQLVGLEPERLLCGHGRGVHERAATLLDAAVRHARRDLPAAFLQLTRARRR